MPFDVGWLTVFLFKRGIGLVYLIAFLVAYRQGPGLIGEDGILLLDQYVEQVPFIQRPSILHLAPSTRGLQLVSGAGIVLSLLAVTGAIDLFGTLPSITGWLLLWGLYLSIVNVGQVFWGYGWESLLLEAGFLTAFLGGLRVAPHPLFGILFAWLLFRVMFGAGLIKWRGDACWKQLTCMDYHYETQPMPNPVSWFFHHAPRWFHKLEVLGNHAVELLVPFLYFAPQPIAGIGATLTILFMSWLIVSGNFAWLNVLTLLLAVPLLPDAWLSFLPIAAPVTHQPGLLHTTAIYGLALLVAVRSVHPAKNLLSSRQAMNRGYDPLHLVNTYGAFGSITRTRYELVVQGTQAEQPTEADWKTYQFHGKPTATDRRPRQWAPYHLRLDWQLWFAAMTPRPRRQWFVNFIDKLLDAEDDVLHLVRHDPFDGAPPEQVRVLRERYRYTTPEEHAETGDWWTRERVGVYLPPRSR